MSKKANVYKKAPKKRKRDISLEILKIIHCLQPRGRFLQFDNEKYTWSEVTVKKESEKVSQSLRDAVNKNSKMKSEQVGLPYGHLLCTDIPEPILPPELYLQSTQSKHTTAIVFSPTFKTKKIGTEREYSCIENNEPTAIESFNKKDFLDVATEVNSKFSKELHPLNLTVISPPDAIMSEKKRLVPSMHSPKGRGKSLQICSFDFKHRMKQSTAAHIDVSHATTSDLIDDELFNELEEALEVLDAQL